MPEEAVCREREEEGNKPCADSTVTKGRTSSSCFRGVWRAAFAERVLARMKIVGKIVVTVVALLVAIAIASTAFEFFFGYRYPALIIITALVIVSPLVFLLWRDRLT